MNTTLYIIDGHSYIYAAFYALRSLTSPSGEPTNATFGFLGTLLKLLRTRNPDIVVLAMDSPGPTFLQMFLFLSPLQLHHNSPVMKLFYWVGYAFHF